jgi:hypothetical protein
MKGVMLSIHPEARLVDVTHKISPQDVMEAAFVLRGALPYIPDDAVHLAVVDPGVGTDRRPIAVRQGARHFVGPDNGLFSLILGGDAPDAVVTLDNPDVWRSPDPSTTFHGRDIFAPVAAHLSAGCSLTDVGTPTDSLKPLRWVHPQTADGTVQGWVVHVDRFGNCITNIQQPALHNAFDDASDPHFKCYVGSTVLESIHHTYGAVADGEPLLLFGSSGFLEVAVNSGHASKLLNIRKGDTVQLVSGDA